MAAYLVVKLGAIGDVAMASTMLTEIRKAGKETSITWVVGKAAAPLLAATGQVDEIILADERAILFGGLWQKILAAASIFRQLSGRKFDVCLVPYRDFRYRLLLLGVRCSDVRTFRKRRWLVPGRYHGFEYARLARGHELSDGMGASFPPLHVASAQSTVPQILLAPGGTGDASDRMRQWPLEYYVRLAGMLYEQGYSIGITGMDKAGTLEEAFQKVPVTSFVNRTDLPDLLHLLRGTRLLITHDSGPVHLMALCGGACLSLFGPTLACEKVVPSSRNLVLRCPDALPCMPCYDGKSYAACAARICMQSILPENVCAVALEYLRGSDDSEQEGEKAQPALYE